MMFKDTGSSGDAHDAPLARTPITALQNDAQAAAETISQLLENRRAQKLLVFVQVPNTAPEEAVQTGSWLAALQSSYRHVTLALLPRFARTVESDVAATEECFVAARSVGATVAAHLGPQKYGTKTSDAVSFGFIHTDMETGFYPSVPFAFVSESVETLEAVVRKIIYARSDQAKPCCLVLRKNIGDMHIEAALDLLARKRLHTRLLIDLTGSDQYDTGHYQAEMLPHVITQYKIAGGKIAGLVLEGSPKRNKEMRALLDALENACV